MSGFFQNLLQDTASGFFGNDYVRDYTHASKTFRSNSYQYSPKFKFLFHVYFDINPNVYNQNVGSGTNYGLAVKTVRLPSFKFDVATLNQYNRKRLIQSKIKYDPIDITFHDDNGTATGTPTQGGIIRSLWKAYYNYYYADGRNPQVVFGGTRGNSAGGAVVGQGGTKASATSANYNDRNQYAPAITGNASWGYIGDTNIPNAASGVKTPFFKNITVFGLSQHNYVAYTLINPLISSFSHDTYDYSQGQGIMEHKMSLEYETVAYNEGSLSGNSPSDIVTGFGLAETYDRKTSPISRPGSNATVLGQGGLVDAAKGFMGALTPDANGSINPLQAAQIAGTAYNTFKNKNLSSILQSDVTSGIINSVNQTPNRNINVATPIFDAAGNGIRKVATALSSPVNIGPSLNTGSQNGPVVQPTRNPIP
jgi:hypothetical protein